MGTKSVEKPQPVTFSVRHTSYAHSSLFTNEASVLILTQMGHKHNLFWGAASKFFVFTYHSTNYYYFVTKVFKYALSGIIFKSL